MSLKLTIKLKPEKSADNPLTNVDPPSNVEGEPSASNSSNLPCHLATNSQDQAQADLSSIKNLENHTTTEDNQNENSQYQLVLYDPSANGAVESETVQEPNGQRPPSLSRPHPFSNQTPRVLPSVGAFTIQCANCFKWRLIPTKEKYEEIREHIIEQPFFCETGREWRPDISCDDPPDISQDGSRLWAIDKPNIAQPPPGWQRLLRIRGEGSSKFADVYYVAPSGKRLRSMVEVQRYLNEHPESIEDGISLSRFSFQTPKPLRENYMRKRPALVNDAGNNGMPGSFVPSEVQPIAWLSPGVDTDLQLSGPGLSTDHSKSPGLNSEIKSVKKKKRMLSKQSCNGDLVYNQSNIDVSESHQL